MISTHCHFKIAAFVILLCELHNFKDFFTFLRVWDVITTYNNKIYNRITPSRYYLRILKIVMYCMFKI